MKNDINILGKENLNSSLGLNSNLDSSLNFNASGNLNSNLKMSKKRRKENFYNKLSTILENANDKIEEINYNGNED